MATSQLSDEHFGAFLLAWAYIYLVPAGCFYLVDARRGLQALLCYLIELPALWRSVLVWCVSSDGRRAWIAARDAVQREEMAFDKQLRTQAVLKRKPGEHFGSAAAEINRLVNQARTKTPRPEPLRNAISEFKAANLRRPTIHKDAILGLHLLQRTVLLLARYALLGWIQRTFMYDPWALLGVAKLASVKEVERAFRSKSLSLHQETGGDRKAFAALLEAKDFIITAHNKTRETGIAAASTYPLPQSVTNVYVASVLACSALLMPVVCIFWGAAPLSWVFPVGFALCHVALLVHLFCIQLGMSFIRFVAVWWCLHAALVLPALIAKPGACRLFHPMALWSIWGPCGFLLANWQGLEVDPVVARAASTTGGAGASAGGGDAHPAATKASKAVEPGKRVAKK